MASIVSTHFPPLTLTDNTLADIIGFINHKNVVVLHTTKACRVFHSISFEQPEHLDSLKNVRVIYIDCNVHEGLLGEGEWEWYIKDAIKDVKELGINSLLRKTIIEQRDVPNKNYLHI